MFLQISINLSTSVDPDNFYYKQNPGLKSVITSDDDDARSRENPKLPEILTLESDKEIQEIYNEAREQQHWKMRLGELKRSGSREKPNVTQPQTLEG